MTCEEKDLSKTADYEEPRRNSCRMNGFATSMRGQQDSGEGDLLGTILHESGAAVCCRHTGTGMLYIASLKSARRKVKRFFNKRGNTYPSPQLSIYWTTVELLGATASLK
jgi:hypothetical protein